MPKSPFSYSRLGVDEQALLATLSQRDARQAPLTLQPTLQLPATLPAIQPAKVEATAKARVVIVDMA
ncbi:hypothetical protein [Chitinimonas naiadis]